MQRIPNWVLSSFFIVTTILIVVFNDVLGKQESFLIFSLFFFALFFIYIVYVVVTQIKIILSLKKEKKQTELLHLKSQVNPHFFFNTLNNLYGLVGQNPEKAQLLILKLSDMMRYSIYDGQNDHVSLGEEITYLENYIELHKMRYHKKIDISFESNVENETLQVMPLLFIILLENAFKHGVENLRKDAFVNIQLNATNHSITFNITNNFDPEEANHSPGIGIQNLKRRLELAYPKKHKLIFNQDDNLFNATLSISL